MTCLQYPYSSQVAELFASYDHSLPIVYSVLEGQRAGRIFVDESSAPRFAVLCTTVGFFYVAGDPAAPDLLNMLDSLLFHSFALEHGLPEMVAFAPSEAWNAVLRRVFDRHHGIVGARHVFRWPAGKRLPSSEDEAVAATGTRILIEPSMQEPGTLHSYPLAQLYVDDVPVCSCSAFMLGRGQAEIDIHTEAGHEGRGYATRTAAALLRHLLENGITPCWTSWPYREASRHVARKLGFEPMPDLPAFIWTVADCGPIRKEEMDKDVQKLRGE